VAEEVSNRRHEEDNEDGGPSYGGTVIGGGVGFAIGGPLGAAVGGALGLLADSAGLRIVARSHSTARRF